MLLPRDPLLYLFRCSWKEFGCNNYILSLCKIPQCTSNILLAGSALICYRRIVEITPRSRPLFMISLECSSSIVQLCCPLAASPNPIQIRDIFNSEFPSFVYFITTCPPVYCISLNHFLTTVSSGRLICTPFAHFTSPLTYLCSSSSLLPPISSGNTERNDRHLYIFPDCLFPTIRESDLTEPLN